MRELVVKRATAGVTAILTPLVFSSLSVISSSFYFANDSIVVIKIHSGEEYCLQPAHCIQFIVILFGFNIIAGESTAAEYIVVEGRSLEMGSMEIPRLEVEVMGK